MDLIELLEYILGPLAGIAAQKVTSWAIAEFWETASPRAKRRVAYAANIVVPTAAYLLGYAAGGWDYDWKLNLVHIVASFTASQVLHGETKLQSGATYVTIPKAEHEALLVTAAAATTGEGVVIAEPAGPVPTVIGN
jgi:hypothetical protein